MIDIEMLKAQVIEWQQTSFAIMINDFDLKLLEFSPQGNKDKAVKLAAFRELAKMLNVHETCLTSEVWMVATDMDTPRSALPKNLGNHPEKKEMFLLVHEMKGKGTKTLLFDILRDKSGKIYDLVDTTKIGPTFHSNMWILNNPDEIPTH